jgi:hypothetical protein
MTVKLCRELQEIYEYELSNGNVVESVVQNNLQETGCVTFKFPLKYDADFAINQIKLPKSISVRIDIEQKNIRYYSSQYNQSIVAPFNSVDIDSILCNEKQLYHERRIRWFNHFLVLAIAIIVVVITLIFVLLVHFSYFKI